MSATPKMSPINEVPMIHHGHNVRAYRKMRKLTQTEFGKKLGKGWDQQKVSELEGKETIDDKDLENAAKALDVTVDELKNHTPEQVTYNIQHNYEKAFEGASNFQAYQYNFQPTFNPIDKIVELYERLLTAEREKK